MDEQKQSLSEKIYHYILYVITIILIIFALLFTATRIITPLLNTNIKTINQWVSKQLDTPVTISKVSLAWQGTQPQISLKDISIYRADQPVEVLHFAKFYISINLIKSLLHWEVVPSQMTLQGVNVSVEKDATGQWKFNDMSLANDTNDHSINFDKVKAWLLLQPNILLENIGVTYKDTEHGIVNTYIHSLNLQNVNQFHKLTTNVSFPGKPANINLIVQTTGDELDWQKGNWQVYVNINKLDPAAYLQAYHVLGYTLIGGRFNTETWLTRQNGQWVNASSKFNIYNLTYSAADKNQQTIRAISANASWQPTKKGWQLALDHLDMTTVHAVWDNVGLMLDYNQPAANQVAQWYLSSSYVNLGDLLAIVQHSSQLPATIKNPLINLDPSGDLKNVVVAANVTNSGLNPYLMKFSFAQLSTHPWQSYPGVQHLQGQFEWHSNSGKFQIASDNAALDFGKMFAKPFFLNNLNSTFTWQKQNGNWQIQANDIQLSNTDLQLNAKFSALWNPAQGSPTVNLTANYQFDSPTQIPNYLPQNAIAPHTLKWLQQAFAGGKQITGNVILKGNLAQFPFDQKQQGIFQVNANLNDLTIHYANGWPDVADLNGTLQFSGRQMQIQLSAGKLGSNTIQTLNLLLPRLQAGKPINLQITSRVSGTGRTIWQTLKDSPLHKDLAGMLDNMELHGPVVLDLGLNIPLPNSEKTQVNGTLHFNQNQLAFPAWHYSLNQIQGDLNFTQQSMLSNKIQAVSLGHPVTILIKTAINKKGMPLATVAFQQALEINSIYPIFPTMKSWPIQGATSIQGNVIIPMAQKYQMQTLLQINSDLVGVAINYPPPIQKTAAQTMPFSMTIGFGADRATIISGNYGDVFSTALELNDKAVFGISRGNVRFGRQLAELPNDSGMVIDGHIDNFNINDWQNLWDKDSSSNTDMTKIKEFIKKVDIEFGQFTGMSFNLHPVRLGLSFTPDSYELQIHSDPIEGQVSIPTDLAHRSVEGNFSHIYLGGDKNQTQNSSNEAHKNTKASDPRQFPAMNFKVGDFRFDQKDFGPISLTAQKVPEGLNITAINFESNLLHGSLSGSWKVTERGIMSDCSGSIETNNLTKLFKQLQMDSSIVGTTGFATFNLKWVGSPFDLSAKKITGDLYLRLGNGWIVNLSQDATKKLDIGKLLTLLSVRHLLLQTNDLSRQGYSFDSMVGHFVFDNGSVTTNDLATKGAVADIKARGSINLVSESLDLELGIIANATSSLPIIATIATGFNPVVGAVTWLADKAVHSAMSNSVNYSYRIVGPWRDPKVEDLKAKQPQTQTQ